MDSKTDKPMTAVERAMVMARQDKEAQKKAKQKAAKEKANADHAARQKEIAQTHSEWKAELLEAVFSYNPGNRGRRPWDEKTVKTIQTYCNALTSYNDSVLGDIRDVGEKISGIIWNTFLKLVLKDQLSDEPVWQMRAMFGMRVPEFDDAYAELQELESLDNVVHLSDLQAG